VHVGERLAVRAATAATAPAPAIAVAALQKHFGEVRAVDGISFEVRQGEIFGLVGPNGAGKTTTLEMIEGLRPPDAGTIEIFGTPVWPSPQRIQRRIGVQLQTTALFDHLTARELVHLFGRLYGPITPERVAAALATVGLTEKSRSLVQALSGGQQQRLAIALALVHEPDIVFLDEPTTGLDPQARRNFWDVIRAIEAEQRTVVLTTHYMEEAEELCDRVAIVDAGRIIALDSPEGLTRTIGGESRILFRTEGLPAGELSRLPGGLTRRAAEGAFELTTLDPPAALRALLDLAERRGGRVGELSVKRPSLEDVFLRLTGREYRQ
jgi:ABC-2 type transport system ATP-binding protein